MSNSEAVKTLKMNVKGQFLTLRAGMERIIQGDFTQ